MTNATHTQGPWTLDETANGWTLLANGGEITADHFDCAKADAHLIAAAPDLLEALWQIVTDAEIDCDTEEAALAALADIRVTARNAITKAQGA
jgi:hypothetical protein